MKARKISYWLATALLALGLAAGGVFDLGQSPAVLETLSHLGYPAYVAPLLGVWKLLGVLAIVAPGFPRLKEWAYAGVIFDLSGAVVSHAAVGDGAGQLVAPLAFMALAAVSWALRPEDRRLPNLPERGGSDRARPRLADAPAA